MLCLCQAQVMQCGLQLSEVVGSCSLGGGHPSKVVDQIENLHLFTKMPVMSWNDAAAYRKLNGRLTSA